MSKFYKIFPLILLFLHYFFFASFGQAAKFVSTGNGQWNTASTWSITAGSDADGVPDLDDTATVNAAHSVTVSSTSQTCYKLTVDGTVTMNANLTIYSLIINSTGAISKGLANLTLQGGTFTNNGSYNETNANGNIYFRIASTTISGTGTFTGNGSWQFQINTTIASSVVVDKSGGNFTLSPGVTVTNNGSMKSGYLNVSSGTWVNAAGSTLTLASNTGTGGITGGGTFNASANPNTVIFEGSGNYNISASNTQPNPIVFYHLTIRGTGTKTLQRSIQVNGNFTLGNSGVITLNANAKDMTFRGNFTTAGTPSITNNTGFMTFDGTAAQSISGTISNIDCANMTLNNSTGLTTSVPMTFTVSVTISAGIFSTGSTSITLTSTSSSTARIETLGATGGISGTNWTIRRYIGGSDTGWADLSSPISGADISDWDNEMYMSIGASCPDGMAAGWQSVYRFDAATQAWVAITSCTEPLTATAGFELWMATTLGSFTPFTLNTIGTPNTGDQTPTLASGVGNWSLIGNPYASGIDWNLIFSDFSTSGVANSFQVYDETIAGYAVWDGDLQIGTGKLSGSNGTIPAHQGFWVQNSSASPTMTIKETHKTATDWALVKPNGSGEINTIKMKLYSDMFKNASEAIVVLKNNASETYEPHHGDVSFLKSRVKETPALTPLSSENKRLVIGTYPANKEELIVPLSATFGVPGNYKIDFRGINLVSAYDCILLEDATEGVMFPLAEDKTYSFTQANIDAERKFFLHFKKSSKGNCNRSVPSILNGIFVSHTQSGAEIFFPFEKETSAEIIVYNTVGQEILSEKINASSGVVSIPLPQKNSFYLIKIITSEGVIVKKFFF